MKVQRLGLDWGPAYVEAEPVRITHEDIVVEIFVSERGDLVIRPVGCSAKVEATGAGGLQMTVTG